MLTKPLGLREDFTLEQAGFNKLKKLEEYDFEYIKQTIVEKFDEAAVVIGDAWLNQHSPMKPEQVRRLIDVIEWESKKFFSLRILYPDSTERFVPSRLVDRVWHQFIIDTQNYMSFCNDMYGAYLHHRPARGDLAHVTVHLTATKAMLEKAYGPLPRMVWGVTAACDVQACMSACFD